MEGTGGQIGIFDNDLLFEEILETLKQQSGVEGCHVIFQAANFPVTSHLTFHVSRFTPHVPI